MSDTATIVPVDVDVLDIAFGGNMAELLPDYDSIPEEFRQHNLGNKWLKFQSDWFFCGLDKLQVVPRNGIDKDMALNHLGAIQGSWEPKHEHKAAAVAYLASLWFKDVSYTKVKA